MKTIAFIAVFGLIPGYHHDNELPIDLALARKYWRMIMEEELIGDDQIFVSAVANESYTIYPQNYGCPSNGEKTISFFGEMNPEFQKNEEKYKEAVIRCCKEMKEKLQQTTVRISFFETDSIYLKD